MKAPHQRAWIALLALVAAAGCDVRGPTNQNPRARPTPRNQVDRESADGPAANAPPANNRAPYQIDLGELSSLSTDAASANTISLCLCVDVSTSMNQKIGGQQKIEIGKAAIQRTLDQLATFAKTHPHKKLLVGLVAFGKSAHVAQTVAPFDQPKLSQTVQSLRTTAGTAVGEAILLSAKELVRTPAGSRAIIVVSDGESNSGVPPAAVVQAIKRDANRQQVATADIQLWLIAFDVNARVFDAVKEAGTKVVESRDQPTLDTMLTTIVADVLAEDPNAP